MNDKKISITIEAEDREDMIYWLERLIERLKESPNSVSGRMCGGGVLDWEIEDTKP